MRKYLLNILLFMTAIIITSCNYAGSNGTPEPKGSNVTWFQSEVLEDMFLYEDYILWGNKLDNVTDESGNPVYFDFYEFSIRDEDKCWQNFPVDRNKLYFWDYPCPSKGYYFTETTEYPCNKIGDLQNVIEYFTDPSWPYIWKVKFDMGGVTYLTDDNSFNDLTGCKLDVNKTGTLYKDAATVIIPDGGTLYGDNDEIDDVVIPAGGKLKCDKMVFDNQTVYFAVDFEPNNFN